jgi:hypothetical protein
VTLKNISQIGARQMLQGTLGVEISLFFENNKHLCREWQSPCGEERVLPEREILTLRFNLSKSSEGLNLSACEPQGSFSSMIIFTYLSKIRG